MFKSSADGQTGEQQGQDVIATMLGWNGAGWDRLRVNMSNISLATLTAQGAAANQPSADQLNPSGRGVKVVVDITAISGTTPTLTVTIQGKDPVSGKYFTLLASAALNATGTTVLTVYPGLTASANAVASDVLPRDWRIIWTAGGTPVITATIAAIVVK